MAEAIAASLIERLICILARKATSQALTYGDLFSRISSEMTDMKRQLELMRVYLKRAHTYSDISETLDAWATFLRDVAFEIEDLVDEYNFIAGEIVQYGGLTSFIYQTIPVFKINKTLRDISARLGKIRNNLSELPKYQSTYQIGMPNAEESSSNSMPAQDVSRYLAETSHLMLEGNTFLWDREMKRLAEWLMDEKQKRLSVIAVQGMGGLGKTTLITRVYRSPEVIRCFILRAWVPVPQPCLIDDLLRRVITELHRENEKAVPVPGNLNVMDYRSLVKKLRLILQQKKYLIVLDDVWEASVWKQIEPAIVDDGCGSRIVITTRIEDVAFSVADDDKVLQLKALGDDEARRLFNKNAFPNGKCPQELESLVEKMVIKCEGLPLALVSMGNYVATQMAQMKGGASSTSSPHSEKEPSLSKHILDSLTSSLQQYNQERHGLKNVHAILELSINNLPWHLRTCFLYCSVFPRGQPIKRKTLIRLWVTEGLVERTEGSACTMEDVAESYLRQLVGRCLFQVVSWNPNGRLRRLKVHNFVHDVIVNRSRKEIMYKVYDGRSARWSMQQVRHLSLVDGEDGQPITKMSFPQLRSLHAFSSSPFNLSIFCFKFLRMLNLENAPLNSLPDDVVSLFNLRFLSIRGTRVKVLPQGIGNLRNLETLDAICSKITSIPKGITKLENLRHLMASTFRLQSAGYRRIRNAVGVPKGVCNLENLQTLKYVIADKFAHNLERMKQIRTLHVAVSTKTACEKLSESIQRLDNLHHLRIQGLGGAMIQKRTAIASTIKRASSRDASTKTKRFLHRRVKALRLRCRQIRVATGLSAPSSSLRVPGELHLGKLTALPPKLQKLLLLGKLENDYNLPTWLNSHTNLTHLDLRYSRLQHDSVIQLKLLPQLVELQLRGAYEGGILFIPPAWLPNLKLIWLVEMDRLETIVIAANALKSLENMNLSACKKLKSIPHGIRNLTNLKKLILDDMPRELVLEIRYRGDSVRHISYIEHHYENHGSWNKEILFPETYAATDQINEQSQTQVSQRSVGEINEQKQRQTVAGQRITGSTGQEIEQSSERTQERDITSTRVQITKAIEPSEDKIQAAAGQEIAQINVPISGTSVTA